MYRKILFISLNMMKDLALNTKAIILLFFCLISLLITFFSTPFLTRELNNLEVFSNLSALIIIFSGCLYLNGDSEFLRTSSYLIIFFVNIAFTLLWASSILKLLLDTYEKILVKRSPRLFFFLQQIVLLFKKKYNTKNKENENELEHRKVKMNTKKINLKMENV